MPVTRLVAVVATALALAAPPALACPSGYESPERLVKHACHVTRVEVISVSDEPMPPAGKQEWSGRIPASEAEHRAARARVRVIGELRDWLPIREFTLIGGPYDSCSPTEVFLHFEVGSRFWLILGEPVAAGTKEIVVSWRCRVCHRDPAEMEAAIESGVAAWQRRLDLLHRVAPEADDGAARLLAERGNVVTTDAPTLAKLSVPVLACLTERLRDPRIVPAAAPVPDAGERATARSGRTPVLSAGLLAEWKRRRVEADEDVVAFRRKVLREYLTSTLRLDGTRADRALAVLNWEPQSEPELPLRGIDPLHRSDGFAASVALLMRLADDEPDALVWATFGGPRLGQYDTSVFAPFLAERAATLPLDWAHLSVTLSIPCKEAAIHVRRALAVEVNRYRYDHYLAFFRAIGDEKTVREVLARQTERK